MQQHPAEREAAGSGTWEVVAAAAGGSGRMKQRRRRKKRGTSDEETEELGEDDTEENMNDGGGGGSERQREHPFIVTEPGEVARGKKNGLDYLFHLYDQCRDFLIQVQNIAKERGEKCPIKVNFNFLITFRVLKSLTLCFFILSSINTWSRARFSLKLNTFESI